MSCTILRFELTSVIFSLFFAGNTRLLLKQTTDLIDICYDCRSGMRTKPESEDLNIEQTTDQLCNLRDVLERLFKASTDGALLEGTDLIHGIISRAKNQLSEVEAALKQESGRKRIRGPLLSFNSAGALTNLGSSTKSLRGALDTIQRYVKDNGGLLGMISNNCVHKGSPQGLPLVIQLPPSPTVSAEYHSSILTTTPDYLCRFHRLPQ